MALGKTSSWQKCWHILSISILILVFWLSGNDETPFPYIMVSLKGRVPKLFPQEVPVNLLNIAEKPMKRDFFYKNFLPHLRKFSKIFYDICCPQYHPQSWLINNPPEAVFPTICWPFICSASRSTPIDLHPNLSCLPPPFPPKKLLTSSPTFAPREMIPENLPSASWVWAYSEGTDSPSWIFKRNR